ncbi:acetyl-hydrolase [Pleomassaria siparia CBS 279.74]|uniref:Acetyl-hydrolase n=1 Tax=Pleomassaria siparia CBS 279.74 TaxID=1314801 RepID=A0A6G1KJN5_9PLEO|nr:acetyl-hydrolase [Pleomassaria siparia CBS 279.74]
MAIMEASPSATLKLLVPKAPFLLKTALWHTLSLSPTSSKWDLKTELTVKMLRQMMGPNSKPDTITNMQRLTTKDPGVKGKIWISKVNINPPEEDALREMLFKAIEDMREGKGEGDVYTKPAAVPLYAEWTGYRDLADDKSSEPTGLSESDKYAALMKETTSKVTILYFHGGAMYLLDPTTYRPQTSKLAKVTGGRVFSVRYRLSPQNPFPAALLDALTAYLTLLYPPPGAPHDPVPAKEIVFAGDSAGGMLSTALLQLLLQIHRSSPTSGTLPTTTFHGKSVSIPLPAGVALFSPWLDVTRSLPSVESHAHYDYLPPPSVAPKVRPLPCEAWPTDPPRSDIYCEDSAMLHPLVSPLAAKDWRGSPPLFFSLGEEMLRDEGAVTAQRVAKQGGKVVWREFEAMPHVFGFMFEWLGESKLSVDEFAAFCKSVVGNGQVESSGQFIKAKTLVKGPRDLSTLTDLGDEKVDELMREAHKRLEKKHGDGSVEAKPKPML